MTGGSNGGAWRTSIPNLIKGAARRKWRLRGGKNVASGDIIGARKEIKSRLEGEKTGSKIKVTASYTLMVKDHVKVVRCNRTLSFFLSPLIFVT